MPMDVERAAQVVDLALPREEPTRQRGSLLILAGLPGVGKSMIAKSLEQLMACVVVSSDFARKLLIESPRYTEDEMSYVYQACWLVIEQRLRTGQRVVFDASNRRQEDRMRLLALAESLNTPAILCHVIADEEIVIQRLTHRKSGARRQGDMSDAGLVPYLWMKDNQDPVEDPSLTLDTTNSPPDILAQLAKDYWLFREREAEGNARRQS